MCSTMCIDEMSSCLPSVVFFDRGILLLILIKERFILATCDVYLKFQLVKVASRMPIHPENVDKK